MRENYTYFNLFDGVLILNNKVFSKTKSAFLMFFITITNISKYY
jgi:hypothetical protein